MSRRRGSRTTVCPTPSKGFFPDRETALSALSEARRRAERTRSVKAPRRAYVCECGSWHLTSWNDAAYAGYLARTT